MQLVRRGVSASQVSPPNAAWVESVAMYVRSAAESYVPVSVGPASQQSLCNPARDCCVAVGNHLMRSPGYRKPSGMLGGTAAKSASRTMSRLASACACVTPALVM